MCDTPRREGRGGGGGGGRKGRQATANSSRHSIVLINWGPRCCFSHFAVKANERLSARDATFDTVALDFTHQHA